MNFKENFGSITAELLVSCEIYPISSEASEKEKRKYKYDQEGYRIHLIKKFLKQKKGKNEYSFDSTQPVGYLGKMKPFFYAGDKEQLLDGKLKKYKVFSCSRTNLQ